MNQNMSIVTTFLKRHDEQGFKIVKELDRNVDNAKGDSGVVNSILDKFPSCKGDSKSDRKLKALLAYLFVWIHVKSAGDGDKEEYLIELLDQSKPQFFSPFREVYLKFKEYKFQVRQLSNLVQKSEESLTYHELFMMSLYLATLQLNPQAAKLFFESQQDGNVTRWLQKLLPWGKYGKKEDASALRSFIIRPMNKVSPLLVKKTQKKELPSLLQFRETCLKRKLTDSYDVYLQRTLSHEKARECFETSLPTNIDIVKSNCGSVRDASDQFLGKGSYNHVFNIHDKAVLRVNICSFETECKDLKTVSDRREHCKADMEMTVDMAQSKLSPKVYDIYFMHFADQCVLVSVVEKMEDFRHIIRKSNPNQHAIYYEQILNMNRDLYIHGRKHVYLDFKPKNTLFRQLGDVNNKYQLCFGDIDKDFIKPWNDCFNVGEGFVIEESTWDKMNRMLFIAQLSIWDDENVFSGFITQNDIDLWNSKIAHVLLNSNIRNFFFHYLPCYRIVKDVIVNRYSGKKIQDLGLLKKANVIFATYLQRSEPLQQQIRQIFQGPLVNHNLAIFHAKMREKFDSLPFHVLWPDMFPMDISFVIDGLKLDDILFANVNKFKRHVIPNIYREVVYRIVILAWEKSLAIPNLIDKSTITFDEKQVKLVLNILTNSDTPLLNLNNLSALKIPTTSSLLWNALST